MRRSVQVALREPLLHFALLGAALFTLVALKQNGHQPEILITAAEVAQLGAYWEAQAQRQPSSAELHALVQELIDEKVLAHEALRAGLDQDDVIIRRRLAQKMAFISEDLAVVAEPGEAALRGYFEEHRSAYVSPALYAMRQIFFSLDSRGMNVERDARLALQRLVRGQDADGIGDPFMLPGELADVSRADIERDLGSALADAVVNATPGTWQGPVRSSFGFHLIRVESRSPMTEARFEEVRDRVREAYVAERRREANAALRAELRRKYRIVVEDATVAGSS